MKDLALNENHYSPAPRVISALKDCDFRFYAPGHILKDGPLPLQKQIAKRFQPPLDPEFIRVTAGAEESLIDIIQSQRDRHILLPEHTWPIYHAHLKDAGTNPGHFKLSQSRNYDPTIIQEAIDIDKPSIVLLCSPNNPTSHLIKRKDLEILLDNDVYIVIDETYRGFSRAQEHYADLPKDHPNLLLIRSFSKFYGLAGARIGYTVAHPDTQRGMRLSHQKMGLNVFSERLATAALDSHDYYAQCAEQVMQDRDAIIDVLNATGKFEANPSETNFVFFKAHPQLVEPIKREFEKEGYRIHVFSEGHFRNYIRFSIGTQDDTKRTIEIIHRIGKM